MTSHGLIPEQPPIRSSDIDLAASAPLIYLIARRYGIVKAFQYSEALSRGTWFHQIFPDIFHPPEVATRIRSDRLFQRLEELRSTCDLLGIQGDSRRTVLDQEAQDAHVTTAWCDAAIHVPYHSDGRTIRSTFIENSSRWTPLAWEARLRTTFGLNDPDLPGLSYRAPVVVQPDLLLLDHDTGTLWIVDLKTTARSVQTRLMNCPNEPQTQLYMAVVARLLKEGLIQHTFALPPSVTLGGMFHFGIRKPALEYGMLDRPHTLDTTPLKSGPRKGQPRNEKIYEGEPSLEIYCQRCIKWYHGLEEYEHLRDQWREDPPVNISETRPSLLAPDSRFLKSLVLRLNTVSSLRNRPPVPELFAPPATVLTPWGDLNPYSRFILEPHDHWPSIVQEEGFIVARRDSGILAEPGLDSRIELQPATPGQP